MNQLSLIKNIAPVKIEFQNPDPLDPLDPSIQFIIHHHLMISISPTTHQSIVDYIFKNTIPESFPEPPTIPETGTLIPVLITLLKLECFLSPGTQVKADGTDLYFFVVDRHYRGDAEHEIPRHDPVKENIVFTGDTISLTVHSNCKLTLFAGTCLQPCSFPSFAFRIKRDMVVTLC
jgi:hypothetical protein